MNFINFIFHHNTVKKHSNFIGIRFFLGLTILITTCVIPTTIFSLENKQSEDRYKKLSNELRCPTCQGLSVKDSDAGFSNSIKSKIRELMKKGKSDKEIMAYFIERYGEWILRTPSVSGFNMVLWLLPGLTIITAFLWMLYRSKKWVEKPKKEMIGLTSDEEQKIMDDLSRFEKS